MENRMVEMRALAGGACSSLAYTGQLKAQLRYDPMGRLHEVTNYVSGVSQGPKRFLYDGDALVAEFDGAGNTIARHVHGPAAGVDDPLISYDSPYVALGYARFLYADPRGSIVYRADAGNYSNHINTYDEYGQPAATNIGRFQYTGQVWLPEIGMSYYKARIYAPRLGRFMQTDPIGYEDNINLYAYVGNDPVNGVDPTGLAENLEQVTGSRISHDFGGAAFHASFLSNTNANLVGGDRRNSRFIGNDADGSTAFFIFQDEDGNWIAGSLETGRAPKADWLEEFLTNLLHGRSVPPPSAEQRSAALDYYRSRQTSGLFSQLWGRNISGVLDRIRRNDPAPPGLTAADGASMRTLLASNYNRGMASGNEAMVAIAAARLRRLEQAGL